MADVTAGFFGVTAPGRRGEILDAALGVFADKGYSAGSMREIAERVGVSEPALYKHFAGKEDLFGTMVEAAAERLRSEAAATLATVDPARIRDTLAGVLRERSLAARSYFPLLRMVLATSVNERVVPDVLKARVLVPLAERLELLVPAVDAHFGVETSADELPRRVKLLMSMFIGYALQSLVFDEVPPETMADAMCAAMGWRCA